MIAEIGILIADYVFTRMVEAMIRLRDTKLLIAFAPLALATMALAMFVGFDLFIRGIGATDSLPSIPDFTR